jgi:hypothetical protein
MARQIPARDTSKYAGQYARAFDAQRILEIFTDSNRIALSSKNPDTAADRFALAVEAYHQLMLMPLTGEVRSSVHQTMTSLVAEFPVQVAVNEAIGLREKAMKLKTLRKRCDLLRRACEIVDAALAAYPSSPTLQRAANELHAELSQLETSP